MAPRSHAAARSRTTLVIPCFDEAGRMPVAEMNEYLVTVPFLSLVMVNDGSRDETGELIESLASMQPGRVKTLHLDQNLGKAEAVRRGVLLAYAGTPDFIGYWDADLATPLQEVERFLDVFADNDRLMAVTGARIAMLGRDIRRKRSRHYMGRAIATMIAVTLGAQVYDTQCGAKLFRATDGVQALFESPFRTGWLFDVELLQRLQKTHGLLEDTVRECPLGSWKDVGTSKVSVWKFPHVVYSLWWLYRNRLAQGALTK